MAAAPETVSPSAKIFIPQEWSDAAEVIAHATPIVFICGPKNCGKSTFSRYLVNVLLRRFKKVAYLETDVGQTEFTPPGLLSLTVIDKINPDLAIPCLKTPERCLFFGDVSSKRDPTMFLSYALSLYEDYMKDMFSSGIPLVINTCGWVKGIGYELLVDMINHISPTHVLNIKISVKSKNLPTGAFWLNCPDTNAVTVMEINAARQDHLGRSVLEQKDASFRRDLHLMTYFQQCFPSYKSFYTYKELARALSAHPPYEVPISSVKIQHLHCQFPVTETFYSLNATIVGLADSVSSKQFPQCVGLGIVRSIDTSRGVLLLITPVPQSILNGVDLLLQGFIQIPSSLLQVQGCVSPYMSTHVLSTY